MGRKSKNESKSKRNNVAVHWSTSWEGSCISPIATHKIGYLSPKSQKGGGMVLFVLEPGGPGLWTLPLFAFRFLGELTNTGLVSWVY